MAATESEQVPWGYRWRSSTVMIFATIMMAMLTSTFLYGIVVPILPYMLEERLGQDPSQTSRTTSLLLAETAIVSVVTGPVIGWIDDRLDSRKVVLIFSMALSMVSSVAIAMTTSMSALFIGRFVQALADGIMAIAGMAVIRLTTPSRHYGTANGLLNLALSAGTSFGPMLGGVLMEYYGYWPAWSSAFVLLAVDIILRLLMIENPKENAEKNARSAEPTESDPLIPSAESPSADTTPSQVREISGIQYYIFIFCQPVYIASLAIQIYLATLVSSFDASLPVHVRDIFDWGSGPSGLLFLGLQAPGIILTPLTGWVKDRVGNRYPTTIAFLMLAPFLVLVGVPGDPRFPWASGDSQRGPQLYILAIVAVGIVSCALHGTSVVETTRLVEHIETESPGIFGPNGGASRAVSLLFTGWTLGTFIGPLLAESLTQAMGYFWMNVVLAILSVLFGSIVFLNLKD